MKKLSKPPQLPHDVFTTCISTVADLDLKSRLHEIVFEIVGDSMNYENLAENVDLHTFPEKQIVGRVKPAQLKNVYTTRMVKAKYPGRSIYDAIIMAPEHGICPLCNDRLITQLDHHLPKSLYPSLSVVPLNLIPVCEGCNKSKKAIKPNNKTDQTFHPYFDDFDTDRWLWASVIQRNTAALKFETRQPLSWDLIKYTRLVNQFKNLDLNKLYTVKAGTELRHIQLRLSNLHDKGGANAVRSSLIIDYESSLDADLNSWKTAMLDALVNNLWYCDGGFIVR